MSNRFQMDTVLVDGKSCRIDGKTKRKINKLLFKFGTTYHNTIPLQEIFDLLDDEGIAPMQEDKTYWEGLVSGRSGRMSLPLALENRCEVSNSMLFLSWYKLENTGRYEIVCYLT